MLIVSCGPKWTETATENGYNLVVNRKGATLGYSPASGVRILEEGGFAFKDLNRNGRLDVYEDWREPAEARARDLAGQLPIEEIAGLMLYSAHQSVPAPYLSDAQKVFLRDDNLRAVLVTSVESPEVAAKWNNNVQAFVEGLNHGIPANNSSDPRNETTATAEFNAGSGGKISQWPTPLGLAATFDPAVAEQFGQIASEEYRALGIATALSPQIDLGTEPRWMRFNGTFGEDPDLDTDMARAYVDGFQTTRGAKDGWGAKSVNAMVKHWPGGGPVEGGRDSHFNYGKYAVYPGNNFEVHLKPFVDGAFRLEGATGSASAIMTFYNLPWNQDPSGKNVGTSFSKYLVTDLLRDRYGFGGVACTDWGVTNDNAAIETFDGKCWGVETLSVAERHYEVLKAGVDQFGGNNDKGPVLEAYRMWVEEFGEESARSRFEQSAVRLLLNSFRTGLFENPYLDPAESSETVGRPDFMKAGYEAQLRSVVMLKNHGGALPQAKKAKVYVPKRFYPVDGGMFGFNSRPAHWDFPFGRELTEKYFEWAATPEEADFALVTIYEPKSNPGYDVSDRARGGNGYVPVSLQYRPYTAATSREVSIAGGDPKESFTNRSYRGKTVTTSNETDLDQVISVKEAMGGKPVVVVLVTTRPVVLSEVEPYADAILVSLGVQNQALLDIVSGEREPSGLMPMQMPANMETVEAQKEDVPRDMECYMDADGNVYDFAFGLNWSGVINDARVKKYK